MKEKTKTICVKNWFKIIIALVILLIGISVFYYLVIFIPEKEQTRQKQEKEETIARKKIECLKIAKEKHKELVEEYESLGRTLITPIYKYNENLDYCLYINEGFFSLPGDSYFHKFIIDCYTNETLAELRYAVSRKADEEVKKRMEQYDNKVLFYLYGITDLPSLPELPKE